MSRTGLKSEHTAEHHISLAGICIYMCNEKTMRRGENSRKGSHNFLVIWKMVNETKKWQLGRPSCQASKPSDTNISTTSGRILCWRDVGELRRIRGMFSWMFHFQTLHFHMTLKTKEIMRKQLQNRCSTRKRNVQQHNFEDPYKSWKLPQFSSSFSVCARTLSFHINRSVHLIIQLLESLVKNFDGVRVLDSPIVTQELKKLGNQPITFFLNVALVFLISFLRIFSNPLLTSRLTCNTRQPWQNALELCILTCTSGGHTVY